MKEKFAKFMAGRYGTDRLNLFLIIVILVCSLIELGLGKNPYLNILLSSWELLLMIVIFLRMFSRNISQRYAENQKYLALENKVRHFFGAQKYRYQQRKEFHIYACPQCKQKIRIPRGKGKICIRCPKCGTEFVKKS